MTVVGLMCNTRAVSRIPLAFIAISTICRFDVQGLARVGIRQAERCLLGMRFLRQR